MSIETRLVFLPDCQGFRQPVTLPETDHRLPHASQELTHRRESAVKQHGQPILAAYALGAQEEAQSFCFDKIEDGPPFG